MTRDDKELLLVDLCSRLPYGVKLKYVEDLVVKKELHIITLNNIYLEHIFNGDGDFKPYLRPMSSMTEEESKEFALLQTDFYINGFLYPIAATNMVNWLNKNMFDYRGLIKKGLAVEAPEGMYNF